MLKKEVDKNKLFVYGFGLGIVILVVIILIGSFVYQKGVFFAPAEIVLKNYGFETDTVGSNPVGWSNNTIRECQSGGNYYARINIDNTAGHTLSGTKSLHMASTHNLVDASTDLIPVEKYRLHNLTANYLIESINDLPVRGNVSVLVGCYDGAGNKVVGSDGKSDHTLALYGNYIIAGAVQTTDFISPSEYFIPSEICRTSNVEKIKIIFRMWSESDILSGGQGQCTTSFQMWIDDVVLKSHYEQGYSKVDLTCKNGYNFVTSSAPKCLHQNHIVSVLEHECGPDSGANKGGVDYSKTRFLDSCGVTDLIFSNNCGVHPDYANDGGYDIYEYGVNVVGTAISQDNCTAGRVTEFWCDSNNASLLRWKNETCPNGCDADGRYCILDEDTSGYENFVFECKNGNDYEIGTDYGDDDFCEKNRTMENYAIYTCNGKSNVDWSTFLASDECDVASNAINTCKETIDDGKDFEERGKVVLGNVTAFLDSCANSTLTEYWCVSGELKRETTVCDVCSNGACIDETSPLGCNEDSDCAVGLYCVSRECVECKTNAHCPGSQVCTNNRCVSQTNVCTSDADCSGNKNYCVSGDCVECKSIANCDSGESCVGNVCISTAECSNDSDCASDEECVNKQCEVIESSKTGGGLKIFLIILIVILAIGIGVVVFFIIKNKRDSSSSPKFQQGTGRPPGGLQQIGQPQQGIRRY